MAKAIVKLSLQQLDVAQKIASARAYIKAMFSPYLSAGNTFLTPPPKSRTLANVNNRTDDVLAKLLLVDGDWSGDGEPKV